MEKSVEKIEYSGFERDTHLTYTSMQNDAEKFFGMTFFKVLDVGPADPKRYRDGARVFFCFQTEADWKKYLARIVQDS